MSDRSADVTNFDSTELVLSIGYHRGDRSKSLATDVDLSKVEDAIVQIMVSAMRVIRGPNNSGIEINILPRMPKGTCAARFKPLKKSGERRKSLDPIFGMLGFTKRIAYKGLIQTMSIFRGYRIKEVTERGVITCGPYDHPHTVLPRVRSLYGDESVRHALWEIVKPLSMEGVDVMLPSGYGGEYNEWQEIKAKELDYFRPTDDELKAS